MLDEAIDVEVQAQALETARSYFSEHQVVLSDGTVVPVRLTGVRAEQWQSCPLRPLVDGPTQVPEGLIGMHVDDATRLANAAGWFVRAHQPDAAITADWSEVRLNLTYDEHGRVTAHDVG